MSDIYSSWLDRQVVLLISAGEARLELRARVVKESNNALRVRVDGCWDVDIFKEMIVRVEADNFASSEPSNLATGEPSLA